MYVKLAPAALCIRSRTEFISFSRVLFHLLALTNLSPFASVGWNCTARNQYEEHRESKYRDYNNASVCDGSMVTDGLGGRGWGRGE